MSTILKALRRLEEDGTIEATNTSGSLPATDPQASNELRSRILAEEMAAEANGVDPHDRPKARRPLLIIAGIASVAAFAALIVGLVIGFNSPVTSDESEAALADSLPGSPSPVAVQVDPANAGQEPMAIPVPLPLPLPLPIPMEDRSTLAANAPQPETPGVQPAAPAPRGEMAFAAVTPTPAFLESQTASANPNSPPPDLAAGSMRTPTRTPVPTPTPIRTRTTTPAPAPTPIRTTRTPARPSPTATERRTTRAEVAASAPNPPTRTKAEPIAATKAKSKPAAEVEEHGRRGLPDVAVLRTAWHPNPSRRSARIRMEETKEILTLKEGDAVGGLVIQEISPSAILFLSGDIEIRLRVGQPGSGG